MHPFPFAAVSSERLAQAERVNLSGTWRFGLIMKIQSKTNYVVQVNHDGTHKNGISGENLGKLAAASPAVGGIAFGQDESALLFRILYPSSWESIIPKSFSTEPISAPKASPSGKRLSHSGDTRPGAILRFSPISTYNYPATLQREALVTFLAHNHGSPPAHVKWHSGTTYWVNWEDLVDEVLCVIFMLLWSINPLVIQAQCIQVI